jgi:hypothetical protein
VLQDLEDPEIRHINTDTFLKSGSSTLFSRTHYVHIYLLVPTVKGRAADGRAESQAARPRPDHQPAQAQPLEDGKDKGGGQQAGHHLHVARPRHRGVSPTKTELGRLGNRSPRVEDACLK